jgi:hypothetical protein
LEQALFVSGEIFLLHALIPHGLALETTWRAKRNHDPTTPILPLNDYIAHPTILSP